jgi:hypothetical protein
MRQARSVHFLHADLGAEGGTIDVSRMDAHIDGDRRLLEDVPVHRSTVSAAACSAREELVRKVEAIERRFVGTGLLLDDPERDAQTGRLERARRAVDRWDFDHVIGPALADLRAPALVAFPGDTDTPRLDLRAALREGVRSGRLAPSIVSEIVCLPTWPETASGLFAHLAELSFAGLPAIDPARTTFLLGPPPPNPLLATLDRMSREDVNEAIRSMPADLEAVAWRALVRAEFVEAAQVAGYRVVPEASSEDLLCAPPSAGGALFLVAHQDEDGVHLHDRPVTPAEVRARLARLAEAPYATVDLSVCGADRPGNLASIFQALGASVVLTRGDIAYDGGMFQRLLRILELVEGGSRLALPELHDLAWTLDSAREKG